VETKLQSFLNSTLDDSELRSRPDRFNPQEKSPIPTKLEAGWIHSHLDALEKKNLFRLSVVELRFVDCSDGSAVIAQTTVARFMPNNPVALQSAL
jgi:hypothetical protein